MRRFDLRGTDLSGAQLANANLEGAILFAAHLKGAILERTHFEGSALKNAAGLRESQLITTSGDASTALPDGVARPAAWLSD
ncbi:pentapeptide repeat-containing protein [Paraburkholderia hospita]|uniref:pentapeptide repeat-containing protein n=1 Tax=Paraburkholderia hospita TaxID=169430 RepID=UPI003F4FB430